jgi:hypothetical protein
MDGHRLMRDATHRIRALYDEDGAAAPVGMVAAGAERRAAVSGG